jgi:hypothetical protein
MRRERLGLSAAFLLFVGAFSYGYFAARTRSFPDRVISHALSEVEDVVDVVRANAHEIRSSQTRGGVTTYEKALASPALTFVTAYDGRLFRPVLIDMEGKVVHRWDTPYSALFKGRKEPDLVPDSRRHLQGAHLYADGSILVSFECRAWPRSTGARARCGCSRSTHHSILPLGDGWGYSRILRLDPATQQVLWSFEGSEAFPFYTSIQGKQQLLGNGNILVSDPEGGRAFEVSPAHPSLGCAPRARVAGQRAPAFQVTSGETGADSCGSLAAPRRAP